MVVSFCKVRCHLQGCLLSACVALREATLEAEQLVLLSLLQTLCAPPEAHDVQRRAVYAGVLPRLQQFLEHPEPQIQNNAVRPSLTSLRKCCVVLCSSV